MCVSYQYSSPDFAHNSLQRERKMVILRFYSYQNLMQHCVDHPRQYATSFSDVPLHCMNHGIYLLMLKHKTAASFCRQKFSILTSRNVNHCGHSLRLSDCNKGFDDEVPDCQCTKQGSNIKDVLLMNIMCAKWLKTKETFYHQYCVSTLKVQC